MLIFIYALPFNRVLDDVNFEMKKEVKIPIWFWKPKGIRCVFVCFSLVIKEVFPFFKKGKAFCLPLYFMKSFQWKPQSAICWTVKRFLLIFSSIYLEELHLFGISSCKEQPGRGSNIRIELCGRGAGVIGSFQQIHFLCCRHLQWHGIWARFRIALMFKQMWKSQLEVCWQVHQCMQQKSLYFSVFHP